MYSVGTAVVRYILIAACLRVHTHVRTFLRLQLNRLFSHSFPPPPPPPTP